MEFGDRCLQSILYRVLFQESRDAGESDWSCVFGGSTGAGCGVARGSARSTPDGRYRRTDEHADRDRGRFGSAGDWTCRCARGSSVRGVRGLPIHERAGNVQPIDGACQPQEQSGASALNFLVIFGGQALAASIAGLAVRRFGYAVVLAAAAITAVLAAIAVRQIRSSTATTSLRNLSSVNLDK